MEEWVKKAKEKIDDEVEFQIWKLKQFSEIEHLDIKWVFETFKNELYSGIKKEMESEE